MHEQIVSVSRLTNPLIIQDDPLNSQEKPPLTWENHSRSISSPGILLPSDQDEISDPMKDYWDRRRTASMAQLDKLNSQQGTITGNNTTFDNVSLGQTLPGMRRSVLVHGLSQNKTNRKIFSETVMISRAGTPVETLSRPSGTIPRPSRPSSTQPRPTSMDKSRPATPAKEYPIVYASGLIKIDGKGVRLHVYEEMPPWLQDNPYIHAGYRLYTSYKENWYSALQWHNETLNIWTHWLGSILFIALIIYSSVFLAPDATPSDKAMFAFYSCTAAITLFLSGLFHTHFPTSEKALVIFCSLDTAGISLLTAGSAMLLAYYCMYCQKGFQGMWLGLLIIVNLVGIVGPFFKAWTSPRFRIARTICLLVAAGISVAPVLMAVGLARGIPSDWPVMTAVWLSVCLFCYLLGALVYVFQIPERWAPGKFDYVFASHQIWHVLVVLAAIALFLAGFTLFEYQSRVGCSI